MDMEEEDGFWFHQILWETITSDPKVVDNIQLMDIYNYQLKIIPSMKF